MRIFQILPTLAFGDAIGNHTIALRRVIQGMGYETEIYAEAVDARLPKEIGYLIDQMPKLQEDDIVLYHLSVGSKLSRTFVNWKCRKIIEYHNVTPPESFKGYSLRARLNCENGISETAYLADKAEYCLADSEFNKQELRNMGYKQPIDVLPILIPFEDYDKKPSKAVLKQYNNKKVNILFTGRIAPNKKQEDIIKAFYYYKKYINSESRLFLVGNYTGMESYYHHLKEYTEKLELEDVYFTGHIRFDEILAYYHLADVFVCMSEHEGFCVPLIEAMYFNIPILAYGGSAVTETLGDGGIMLSEKDPKLTAEWINRMVEDRSLRQFISEKQKSRLKEFRYETVADLFKTYISRFIGDSRSTADSTSAGEKS